MEDHLTLNDIHKINKLMSKEEIIIAYRKKKLKKSSDCCLPPSWTDKHEVHLCMNPECGQKIGIINSKVNCYCCGK